MAHACPIPATGLSYPGGEVIRICALIIGAARPKRSAVMKVNLRRCRSDAR